MNRGLIFITTKCPSSDISTMVKKMKRKLVCTFIVFVTLFTSLCLTACGNNSNEGNAPEHDHIAGYFNIDDNSHWYKCDICDEKFSKEAHNLNDGNCAVCGYSENCTSGLQYAPITKEEDKNNVIKWAIAYRVTGYGSASDADLDIPAYYNGLPVISVGDSAFKDNNLIESVKLGRNIDSIGVSSFRNCINLQTVKLNDNLNTIGNYAFENSALTDIHIPDGVTSIGSNAFNGSSYYNDETKWQNDALYVDSCLIAVKTNLSGVFNIKQGVKIIAGSAFKNCSLITNITFPESLTHIGEYAFLNSGIVSVSIPDSIISIAYNAFEGCTFLKDISLGDNLGDLYYTSFTDTAFYKDQNNWENQVLYIGKHLIAFKNTKISEYSIKDGTLTIAPVAFSTNRDNLQEVTIPNSVELIGKAAFNNCDGLHNVNIGENVKYIGENAFSNCYNLSTITYGGTKSQWKAINKNKNWHTNCYATLTIVCTDGNLDENDKAI